MNEYDNQAQNYFSKKTAEYIERNGLITEREEAILFAQGIELCNLKSPQSAIFPNINEFNVEVKGDVYVVTGYVDSQNSYGAMIRTPFTLSVKKTNERWQCVNNFISNEKIISNQMLQNSVIWWILSILGTIITFFIIYNTTMGDLL